MKKNLIFKLCTIMVLCIFIVFLCLGHFSSLNNFISKIEKNSFDLRQTLISKYKKANSDIVILTVDDATYEYIMDKYGSWPISRKIWAEVINSLEEVNPKFLIFDMLFLKPNLSDVTADNKLINAVENNQNVFLSMNFDNYSDDIRKSPILDKKFELNIKQGELKDNEYINYINARTVMKDLSNATDNIGIISIIRDSDGIIREATPIFKYKNNYYPNLSLAVAKKLYNVEIIPLYTYKTDNLEKLISMTDGKYHKQMRLFVALYSLALHIIYICY